MNFFKNKSARYMKAFFTLLIISINLYGCSSQNTTKTMQSTWYTLPSDTPIEDCHYGKNKINSPLVTNKIPDNNMYPFTHDGYTPSTFVINQKIYFVDNTNLYEATPSDNQEDWNTVSLNIGNISEMLSDGTYLYCLTENNTGIIYNPKSHTINCKVLLPNSLHAYDGYYALNCVGNQKGYFTLNFSKTKDAHIIFSLDQNGQIEIMNTSDRSNFIRPVYSDSEYFVYVSFPPEKDSNFHVYVQNLQTNETYSIYDQFTVNMNESCAPFYRWNNSFVFLTYEKGICVANIDGSGVKIYHGDITYYSMYQNKMYFSGSKLFSFDLETGEKKIYKFSDEDNFMGNLNICDGYILLSRKEANSRNMTIHAIQIP